MLTRKMFWALGIISLFFACSGIALAQNPVKAQMFKNQLGLTGEQMSQLKELGGKFREDVLPLEQQLKAKNQALHAAFEASPPNATTVGQIVLDQQALRQQLRQRNGKLRADIFAVLTPQQRQKIAGLGVASLIEILRKG